MLGNQWKGGGGQQEGEGGQGEGKDTSTKLEKTLFFSKQESALQNSQNHEASDKCSDSNY